MGEVVPGECIMNALPADDCLGTWVSSGFRHAWEALWEVLVVEQATEGGAAMVESLMEEEDEEEEDQRRGSSTAGRLAPR